MLRKLNKQNSKEQQLLTQDLWIRVLQYLPITSNLPQVSLVNHQLHTCCQNDLLWKTISESYFLKKRFSNYYVFPKANFKDFFIELLMRNKQQNTQAKQLDHQYKQYVHVYIL